MGPETGKQSGELFSVDGNGNITAADRQRLNGTVKFPVTEVELLSECETYGARANPGFDPLRNKKAGQTCFFIVNGGAEGDCRAKTIQRNVFAEISSSC